MKLKYEFETATLGDRIMAVPVGEAAAELQIILSLNASSAIILELLKEETTVDEIVTELMRKYGRSREALTVSVNQFVDKLSAAHLLSE